MKNDLPRSTSRANWFDEAAAFAELGDSYQLQIFSHLAKAGSEGCAGPGLLSPGSRMDSRELVHRMKRLAAVGLVHGEVRGRVVHYFVKAQAAQALIAALRGDLYTYLTKQDPKA
ncbi:hypothetical protein CATMIT_01679 [Catenibacterium mitsuokai DSM 15897]|uniref:Transcriptional regulator n=1 Tax=Lysobacter enzymogenes TaxID=69 RepID=A0AAU9B9U0_LYSEN|nr:hypothetical protein [Lysobacter enzymogenes]EEF93687.1 hypothetical protein CATMIT_01679 [Catenibacterium mitsuokai DSM 15897]BAV99851.1 conserved hypothetical protein [Lysobacter enzymogenes]